MILIRESAQSEILTYAFRYCLGRSTYCTKSMQDEIKFAWPGLTDGDKELYKREILEAKERGRLGMEMDAKGWLEILDLES